jgi:lysophospholipase L1-like esterase
VVVLNYGHFETIHLFLPQRLERHVHSMSGRPGRFRGLYRTSLRKVWRLLARLQQQLDLRVDSTFFKGRPRRVTADLVRLVERVQYIGSPLVFIVELTPPGASFRKWFPGMAERTAEINKALAEVVRRTDLPNVRYFPTNTLLAPLMADGQEVNPDGGHFTPEAHRMIGERLAEEIIEWAAQEGLIDNADVSAHDRGIRAVPD